MARQKNTKKDVKNVKKSSSHQGNSKSSHQGNSNPPAYERKGQPFHFEFKNASQKMAWAAYEKHDILFLIGPAGSAKTFLATAFAIKDLSHGKKNIILTRPIVEAGEKLGFLPGDFNEKVDPYMTPLHDSISKIAIGNYKEEVYKAVQIRPLAYMRGTTFDDSVCIFDEAQNATKKQLKLFLTRLGQNSKMIITGDPSQCDLVDSRTDLMHVIDKVSKIRGVGVVEFKEDSIVRHPIVREIVKVLPD